MGKAFSYALEQWSELKVFLGNGKVEIDNNLVENAIRPTFSPVYLPPLLAHGPAATCPGRRRLGPGRRRLGHRQEELALHPFGCAQGTRGDAGAGERGAILYTIVESPSTGSGPCGCRRLGVDPCAYLRDILTLLPRATNRQIPDLTPQAWAQARKIAVELKAAA